MSTLLVSSKIRFDGGTQPREELDQFTIAEYQDVVHNGGKLPPITVFYDGETYWCADGFPAEARLKELRAMTLAEAEQKAQDEWEQQCREREKAVARGREITARYDAIRAEVQAWQPPTPAHEELKVFMLQQLRVSTEFGPYIPDVRMKLTGAEWLQYHSDDALKDIARANEQMQKERALSEKRLAWVNALRASVPQP